MAENQTVQPDTAQLPANDDQDREAGASTDAPVGLTQAQLNAIIANEKKQARLSALKELGDVEALKAKAAKLDEIEAASMSEMEKLQRQLTEMQTQIQQKEAAVKQAERNALRVQIAAEMNIPQLANRLTGDDDESIRADAQALLDSLKGLAGQDVTRPPDIDATKGGEQRQTGKSGTIPPAIQALIARGLLTEQSWRAAQDAMEAKT